MIEDLPRDHWHVCMDCGRGYPSRTIAEDCADQDAIECDLRQRNELYP